MGKKINTRHKNFLADLQALMKKRYKVSREGYTEQDKQREALITGEPVKPIQSSNWRRRRATARSNKDLKDEAIKFEAEYAAFIKSLKTKKVEPATVPEAIHTENTVAESIIEPVQTVLQIEEPVSSRESLPEQPTRRRHLRRVNIGESNESQMEEKKEEEFDPFAEF